MSAAPEPGCRACGATGELELVTSHALAGGSERTEWFRTGVPACDGRYFPELADLAAQAEAEAAT